MRPQTNHRGEETSHDPRSWLRRLFARTPRWAPEGPRNAPGGPAPTLSARVVGLAGRGKLRPAAPREKSWPLPAAALAPQCRSEPNNRGNQLGGFLAIPWRSLSAVFGL